MADETKVVTLENLKTVAEKIKTDYAKKTYVDEKVGAAGEVGELTYATDEEVLALFEDDEPEEAE